MSIKKIASVLLLCLIAIGGLADCAKKGAYQRGIYMLVDSSGTYVHELDKAHRIINYLLGTLDPGDAFAVARVKSRSFSEKDIVAKATFDTDPIKANEQKRTFQEKISAQLQAMEKQGSAYTDITGGILQGAEFLNETGVGRKTILIFSDMQEELDKSTVRDIPLNLTGIRVVALNVTKLQTDNVDPRKYLGRLEWWEKRVRDAGAKDWVVVNDLEHLERILGD